MAKVGLKETLALLAAGYKKKDIEALAAIDEETPEEAPAPVPEVKVEENKEEAPAEPDYKAMYEELKKKNEETQAKITKLQQDNIHADSSGITDDAKKAEQEGLVNMVRSFM